jgi:hypothetical protein
VPHRWGVEAAHGRMAGDRMNGCRFAATGAAVFAAASLASSPALAGQSPAPTSEIRVPVGDASPGARDFGRGRPSSCFTVDPVSITHICGRSSMSSQTPIASSTTTSAAAGNPLRTFGRRTSRFHRIWMLSTTCGATFDSTRRCRSDALGHRPRVEFALCNPKLVPHLVADESRARVARRTTDEALSLGPATP